MTPLSRPLAAAALVLGLAHPLPADDGGAAQLERARALDRAGNKLAAEEALTGLITSAGASPSLRAEALCERGHVRLARGAREEARGDLQAAARHEPREPLRCARAGLALVRLGAGVEGLAALDDAVLLGREQPQVWVARARAHHRLGQLAKALSDARVAAGLEHTTVEAPLVLAQLHVEQGALERAAAELAEVAAAVPRSWFLVALQLWLSLARGEEEPAARALARLRSLAPEEPYVQLSCAAHALWQRREPGPEDTRALEQLAASSGSSASLARALLGREGPEATLKAAGDDAGRQVEARFYLAARARLLGDDDDVVRAHLEAARATRELGYLEHFAAGALLAGGTLEPPREPAPRRLGPF